MECRIVEYEYGLMRMKFNNIQGEQQYSVWEYEEKIKPNKERKEYKMEIEWLIYGAIVMIGGYL